MAVAWACSFNSSRSRLMVSACCSMVASSFPRSADRLAPWTRLSQRKKLAKMTRYIPTRTRNLSISLSRPLPTFLLCVCVTLEPGLQALSTRAPALVAIRKLRCLLLPPAKKKTKIKSQGGLVYTVPLPPQLSIARRAVCTCIRSSVCLSTQACSTGEACKTCFLRTFSLSSLRDLSSC